MFNLYSIGGSELTDYERSATVLTLLACPIDTEDENRRCEIFDWLCGRAVKLKMERDPSWAGKTQSIKPSHVVSAARQTGTDFGPIGKRLRDRMVAAKIAMPFLQQTQTGKAPELPPGVKRLSLNEMCEFCLVDSNQSDQCNVETRIWRPSRPVIHLACAIAVMINDLERLGFPLTFDDLLMHWTFTRDILHLAQSYEEVVVKSPGLYIPPSDLIRIRIACPWAAAEQTQAELKAADNS